MAASAVLRTPSPSRAARLSAAAAFLLLLAAGSVGLALLPGCAASEAPERPRNIILFLVDTLRADRLGCYGYARDTSPRLDALAARGTLYTENRSQSCWTVPSMISLMSGLYVTQREARTPEQTLLAERMHSAGWDTAAFIGNATLVNDRGFQRGFGTFEVTRGTGQAQELVGLFERWHGQRAATDTRGFFAWIHPLDPHHPYAPSTDHNLFRDEPRADETRLVPIWEAAQPRAEELAAPEEALGAPEAARKMRTLSNRYDGEVHAADAALGRLLEYLEHAGILEETLIVFASDHGEKLWEHERYEAEVLYRREKRGPLVEGVLETFGCGHRAWFHEELWRTPLVFAGPGFPAGSRVDGLSANLDIYPTILAAAGLPSDAHLAGENLLGGQRPQREQVFAYGFETTASVDARGLKFIEHAVEHYGSGRGNEPSELFDLAADPDEREDLALGRIELVEQQRASHSLWRADHGREVDTSESAAALEALQRLGYIDEEGEPRK